MVCGEISTPGVWGVESDNEDIYVDTLYEEELKLLSDMLEAIGLQI